jgi:hypothetical protein
MKRTNTSNQWAVSTTTLLGYPALRNAVTGELALAGNLGEIFLKNSTTCKLRTWNPRAIRAKAYTGLPYRSGDEAVFEFPVTEIKKYVKLLQVPIAYTDKELMR